MNIGINLSALLNTRINEAFLESVKDSKAGQILLKFANDHGYFGTDAVGFLVDLVNILEKASEAVEKEKNK